MHQLIPEVLGVVHLQKFMEIEAHGGLSKIYAL